MFNAEKVKKCLFQVFELRADSQIEKHIGNGGVVKHPDGRILATTAAHVAFDDEQRRRDLIIHPLCPGLLPEETKPHFNRVESWKYGGQDIAEAEIGVPDGLPLTEIIDPDEEYFLMGKRRSFQVYQIPIALSLPPHLEYLNRKDSQGGISDPHFLFQVRGRKIIGGMSGSLIINSRGEAAGVETHSNQFLDTKGFFGIAQNLPFYLSNGGRRYFDDP